MRSKGFLFLIILLLSFSAIFMISGFAAPIAKIIYWVILGQIIFTIWLFKLNSRVVLLASFVLFVIAGLLTTFSLTVLSEIIMRLSFLGWLIGFSQAVSEYLVQKENLKG